MSVGDPVAVFDAVQSRWCGAQIVSVHRASAFVRLTQRGVLWLVPLVPSWVRPVHLVVS
jgi:hypothetical protein